MEDGKVLKHIEDLVAEEDKLYATKDLNDSGLERLHIIKSELDQYWDFLRQRRALRNAGQDPSNAELRSVEDVENDVE